MLCLSLESCFIEEVTLGGWQPLGAPHTQRPCALGVSPNQGLPAAPKGCQPWRGFTSFMAK